MERRQHHVRGVQRVDEVWREGVLLFHRVGSPAEEEKMGRFSQRDRLIRDGLVTNGAADTDQFRGRKVP